nr:hypothetical protein BaRGS_004727 [Batillaria attramentaria]
MVFMSGALFGSVACGLPSDIFGRKKMLMISLVLHSVASLVITWSSYFPFLCVLLFLNGAAVTGIFTNAFVIGMELVGPSKRVWTGYVMEIFWSLGMMLLAPIAFFVRDWQRLQLTTSLLTLPFLSYWWLVPESPRWLMSRGRRQEAEAILQTVAKTNKVCLPEKLLDGAECLREEERQVEEESVLAALQHPAILTRCFVIFYAWMVSSLTFYGLNLNVGSLSGNVYVNFLLSGIMELVSYILCLCLLDRVGRRALNCGLMILAGVTCTATIFPVLYAPPSWQWLTVALAMVGKLGIAGAFATIWVYTSELLPTVIRNSGVGASSFCARIGAIISPYIANLDQTIGGNAGKAVPLVIFGVSSMIAGLLLLFLPETLNRRLPETVQDVIDMGRK